MFTACIAIQIVGIIVLAIEIVYLFTRNSSRLQLTLLIMSICVFINFMGETGEMLSTDAATALMGVRFSYLGKPFILFSCLLFMIDYCNVSIKKWKLGVLFVIQASVAVLAFTCPYHTLYYSSIGWTEQGMFPHLVLGKSIIYWIYSAIITIYLIVFIILIVRQMRRSKTHSQRKQATNLLAMVVVMIASLIIYLTGVTQGYDLTLVGYTIALILLVHAILRHNLFETMTLARESALRDSDDGMVVLNQRNDIIYANPVAGRILGIETDFKERLSGKKPNYVTDEILEKLDGYATDNAPIPYNERYYEVRKRDLSREGTSYGVTYELKDVTESYTYSSRLERDVEEKTYEIKRIQREVTISFANMVEARDDVTGAHIKNTSTYVSIITRSLQEMMAEQADSDPARVEALWGPGYEAALFPDFLETLVDVAPLHDVGKIGIPDAILRKPGKLTDEEFDVMKTHTTKGVEVIESTLAGIEEPEYVLMAKNVAGGHHEKWNGRGYPAGLAGADIPLSGRIMAIADVYDALLARRSYKEPFSHEKAYEIIVQDAGQHFDPVLVEAFERARAEMEAVSPE